MILRRAACNLQDRRTAKTEIDNAMERGAIGLQHVEDQRADLLVDVEEKLVRTPAFETER